MLTSSEIVVPCPEGIEATLEHMIGLGYRLELIFPADAPRVAVVAGHGLRLRLDRDGRVTVPAAAPPLGPLATPLTINRATDSWSTGRAGMRYRDLLPGRAGGHVIASQINIPEAGPVPDYVHYHRVGFQMIYCVRGRVRVVYQDQGPPFWLEAGDCVLQPPTIRHRVLESADGLEVVEISVPAEHPTLVDHELELPTPTVTRDRLYGGQRFVHHRAAEHGAGDVRDIGITEATGGLASARVLSNPATLSGTGALTLAIVLAGEATLAGDHGALSVADTCAIPGGGELEIEDRSATLEILVATINDASAA